MSEQSGREESGKRPGTPAGGGTRARSSTTVSSTDPAEFFRQLQQRPARALEGLPNSALVDREHAQRIRLRGWYAVSVLIVLGAQLAAADVLVYLYAWKGVDWNVRTSVLQAWLAATVIEVVGVVLVVTRSLFPSGHAKD
jgi:hypothetical protein